MSNILNGEQRKTVFDLIEKDFGKTFDELKPAIKAIGVQYAKDYKGDNCYEKKITEKSGYRIFYNTNPNFKQGAWNGGGLGWFVELRGVGMVATYRIETDSK